MHCSLNRTKRLLLLSALLTANLRLFSTESTIISKLPTLIRSASPMILPRSLWFDSMISPHFARYGVRPLARVAIFLDRQIIICFRAVEFLAFIVEAKQEINPSMGGVSQPTRPFCWDFNNKVQT